MEKAFEDCMMPLPVGYDAYLRTVFGDYMELPPEKRPGGSPRLRISGSS